MRIIHEKKRITSFIILALFWALFCLSESPFHSASQNSSEALFSTIMLIVLISASFIALLFFNDSFVRNFLVITLFLGIFFIFLRPFSCNIDEEYHFFRSYELSLGKLFPSETGIIVPKGYAVYAERERWNLTTIIDDSIWFNQVTENVLFPRMRSASYLFIQYIPGALGIKIARLLKLPLVGIVLFGRLFYYLFFIGVCYLALKRTETLRSVIFLVALSGGTVLLYGVIQPDLVLIPCCLLYVSICLHYCFDEIHGMVINRTDTLLLALSALIISSIKYCGYVLILLFVFFIPKNRYENKKKTIIAIAVCVGVSVVLQVYALIRYHGSLGDAPPGVDMLGQIQFIIDHPIQAIKTIGGDLVGYSYIRVFEQISSSDSFIGIITYTYAILPVLGALLSQDRPVIEDKKRKSYLIVYCFCVSFILQFIVNLSLFTNWTPVGASTIDGIQRRYTLPFLLLVLIPLSFISIENRNQKWNAFISCFSLIAILNSLLSLYESTLLV